MSSRTRWWGSCSTSSPSCKTKALTRSTSATHGTSLRATAALMDDYVAEHLPSVAARVPRGSGSWHSYTFGLDPSAIGDLRSDLARIDNADWRTKVRYNPEVDDASLEGFLAGSDRPASGRTRCLSINSRLDVLPTGEAITCKLFPELAVGRLDTSDVADVWHGPRAAGAAPDRRPARPHARLL